MQLYHSYPWHEFCGQSFRSWNRQPVVYLSMVMCFFLGRFHGCAWWRHQMETFSALLVICAGNSPVPGEFPAQRPVTRSLDVFFDLRLNKRLSKQSWGWWFETLSLPLWRHCNVAWWAAWGTKIVLHVYASICRGRWSRTINNSIHTCLCVITAYHECMHSYSTK